MEAAPRQPVTMLERWLAFGLLLAILFSYAHCFNEDGSAPAPTFGPLPAPPDDDARRERRDPRAADDEEEDEDRERARSVLGGLLGGDDDDDDD